MPTELTSLASLKMAATSHNINVLVFKSKVYYTSLVKIYTIHCNKKKQKQTTWGKNVGDDLLGHPPLKNIPSC